MQISLGGTPPARMLSQRIAGEYRCRLRASELLTDDDR